MNRRMVIAFAVQAMVLAVLLTTALDVYAHKRVEQLGGVNMWGYRGATARQKQANEIRVGVVGGTMAFGWGVAAEESMITSVRRLVSLAFDRPGGAPTYVNAFNLALTGLPHARYAERLAKYAALDLDIVCVYPDPLDLAQSRMLVPRASAVERLTGYTPILPVVLDEKGVPLAGALWRAIDAAAYRVLAPERPGTVADPADAVIAAVEEGMRLSRGVVVALPVPREEGREGIPGLRAALSQQFGGSARVHVVDVAAADPRVLDPSLRLDGDSFGAGGNALVGEAISPAVIDLLRRADIGS